MNHLRRNHDFILVDAGPILAADDAAALAPQVDAVVVVVRPFYTRSRLVRQALDMLYQRKAKQVAIILNRARKDDLGGHYARNGHAARARNRARNGSDVDTTASRSEGSSARTNGQG